MNYAATLLIGSALGSSILGVVFALVYMRTNNITEKLKININYASAPAKFFFAKLEPNSLFEIVDMPIETRDVPSTVGLDAKELFYTPGTPGYELFETNFDVLVDTFTVFWESIGLMNTGSENYTCVHIRRGDKLIYETFLKVNSIEEYIKEIETLGLQNKPIVVITDDYPTFSEFKNQRPEWNITTTSTSSNLGFNITKINDESPEVVKLEVERILEDLKILSKSGYFIGTKSSSVSFIGKLLKNKQVSLLC
jgi:hypothetical protein